MVLVPTLPSAFLLYVNNVVWEIATVAAWYWLFEFLSSSGPSFCSSLLFVGIRFILWVVVLFRVF